MKSFFLSLFLVFSSLSLYAQGKNFHAYIYNKEYDVIIQMNLYEERIKIPGQEILGEVYGYLKKATDSRVWAIMSAKIDKDDKKAELEIINDYGSDDLKAILTYNPDGTYTLKQLDGSTIKVAGKNKWIKLPNVLVFTKN